jgi:hypothetical protein
MQPQSEQSDGFMMTSFSAHWSALEQDFADAAMVDGDVYLPVFPPSGPVDAILIGMEPSLGRWARTPVEAGRRISAGFKNFMWSVEDFIVHHAVRRVLCAGGQTYHLTDVSKGAMTVEKAHVDRRARYARWSALLERELRLVSKPDARVIAIGRDVEKVLARMSGVRQFTGILHYSPLASAGRDAAVRGREEEFTSFAKALELTDIIEVAREVLREHSVPAPLVAETLRRLEKAQLSVCRKKLAFSYAVAFSEFRARAA